MVIFKNGCNLCACDNFHRGLHRKLCGIRSKKQALPFVCGGALRVHCGNRTACCANDFKMMFFHKKQEKNAK